MGGPAARGAAGLLGHGLALAQVAAQVLDCPTRACLPEDATQGGASGGKRLCYTLSGGHESFARCTSPAAPFCTKCLTTPPCESWCEAEAFEPLPLGSPCHLDRQCGGDPLAACHLGVCRRALWAGQQCDEADEQGVCLFGRQRCTDGICEGLGTNGACWDGYPAGLDLDCQPGWYCLRAFCVPQLPNGHTCYGEHPSECLKGHLCNLLSERPQCVREFSLPVGVRASDRRLCASAHVDPMFAECAPAPPYDSSGGGCRSSADCVRGDGSFGRCRCKVWWQGGDEPGFCEVFVPEPELPSYMAFRRLQVQHCHHDWSEERCAVEIGETALLRLVEQERLTTADPTVPVPPCAHDLISVAHTGRAARGSGASAARALLILAIAGIIASRGTAPDPAAG